MKDVVLSLYAPPHTGTDAPAVAQLGPNVERFEIAKRRLGGHWYAQWWMPLDERNPRDGLREFFDGYLGFKVEARSAGGLVWGGIITTMELTLSGITRRLARENIYNAVRCIATDTEGNQYDTANSSGLTIDNRGYLSHAASIAQYDRRELIFTLSDADATMADAAVTTQLKQTQFPLAEAIDISPDKEEGLLVECGGLVVLLNDRYVSINQSNGGSEAITISAYIEAILGTDANTNSIQKGFVETNDTPTKRIMPDTHIRAWDKILELTEVGDVDGNPWTFHVDANGRARYEQADTTVRYHWTAQGLKTATGQAISWAIEPGVLRDMTAAYGVGRTSDTFLQDGRDIWIAEVEMSEGAGMPTLKPEGFNPDEQRQAYDKNRRFLEQEMQP